MFTDLLCLYRSMKVLKRILCVHQKTSYKCYIQYGWLHTTGKYLIQVFELIVATVLGKSGEK